MYWAVSMGESPCDCIVYAKCPLAPHGPYLKLTDMEEKLKKIVKEGNELIREIPHQENPKRKILLHRAKKAIDTFEVAMNKLLQ
jgi:hypothetical protein